MIDRAVGRKAWVHSESLDEKRTHGGGWLEMEDVVGQRCRLCVYAKRNQKWKQKQQQEKSLCWRKRIKTQSRGGCVICTKNIILLFRALSCWVLFPLVMQEIVAQLSDGLSFSVHIGWDGARMVLSMPITDVVSVWMVVVRAVLTEDTWEDELLRLAARFIAGFSNVPHVHPLVVWEDVGLQTPGREKCAANLPRSWNMWTTGSVRDDSEGQSENFCVVGAE